MRSAFDTRAARFNPEQTFVLTAAYKLALEALPDEKRLSTNMKSKLAKLIVNLGRERLRQKRDIEAEDISTKATAFLKQLRVASPLN